MLEPGATFKAKYAGICAACRGSHLENIKVGDEMVWYSSQEVYHWDCRPTGMEPKPDELQQEGYLFIDLETGGLNEREDGIVQVALITTSNNLLIKQTWSSLILPPHHLGIGQKAIEVHGWTREKLKDAGALSEQEVMEDLLMLYMSFPDHRFAGYNCPFDLKFLDQGFKRCGINVTPWLMPPFDLLVDARKKLRNKTANHKLGTVAKHYGFNTDNAHDALCDLFLTVSAARFLQGEAA